MDELAVGRHVRGPGAEHSERWRIFQNGTNFTAKAQVMINSFEFIALFKT